MLVLVSVLIGLGVGGVTGLVVGRRAHWAEIIVVATTGSVVLGVLTSLAFDEELGLTSAGLVGSVVGAVLATLIGQRAWVLLAVALTPVGWALTVLLGFGFEGIAGTWPQLAAAFLMGLVSLAAPTAAVIVATTSARAAPPSGRAPVVVSVVLLLVTLLALPFLVTGFGWGWVATLLVVAGVLGLAEWLHHAAARRRRVVMTGAVTAAVAALVALGVALVVVVGQGGNWQPPAFPSLAAHPDTSLHGTVAYLSTESGCVRVRSAAGRPAKDVYCLPQPKNSAKAGKAIGPQLRWLPGGRLEVTMFRMFGPPPFKPGWQKIVDVRTGTVENVPASDVPAQPRPQDQPKVSPSGERISTTNRAGRAEVVLTDSKGSRTLLSVQAPYDFQFSAFWAPNWQWVVVSDIDRILVITTGDPSRTRVLAPDVGWNEFGYAVTGADLLTPAR